MAQDPNHPYLKIQLGGQGNHTFTCKKCPIGHHQTQCPKAESKDRFEFDMNQLTDMLQRRFVEIASDYEKYKLQQVCKKFNGYLRPQTFAVTNCLIAHANAMHAEDDPFWSVSRDTSYANPDVEAHLEKLQNLIVCRKFNGVALPDNWLSRLIDQNVKFYLTHLHLHDCKITGMDLEKLCDYGALNRLFIDKVIVEPSPKASDLARWSTNIVRFHVNIKNFECENNFMRSFAQFSDKRTIRLFNFTNLSPVFDPNELDKFIRTRMISTKEDYAEAGKSEDEDIAVRLAFRDQDLKKLTKKGFENKLTRMFKGVFKQVSKVQYETFASTDRFIVDGRREEKSGKNYFFVNCRAVDSLMKKVKQEQIERGMKNMKINK